MHALGKYISPTLTVHSGKRRVIFPMSVSIGNATVQVYVIKFIIIIPACSGELFFFLALYLLILTLKLFHLVSMKYAFWSFELENNLIECMTETALVLPMKEWKYVCSTLSIMFSVTDLSSGNFNSWSFNYCSLTNVIVLPKHL